MVSRDGSSLRSGRGGTAHAGDQTTAFVLLLIVLLPGFACAQEPTRSVHVFVALCDNDHQGIVPVPKGLGNGAEPAGNLYWGALYGVKTTFCKSGDWTLVAGSRAPVCSVLERCVFRHKTAPVFLTADAYRGSRIKDAVSHLLSAAAGKQRTPLQVGEKRIGIHGAADLLVYVGHNGLMDFYLPAVEPGERVHKDAIVLACKSKPYFEPRLSAVGARPVLLTTGFMAPEAYTLEAALDGWVRGESPEQIRSRAAAAYAEYQKCGMKAAKRLFYAGE